MHKWVSALPIFIGLIVAQDYAVSISCEDQLSSTGGNFDLEFSRVRPPDAIDRKSVV